MSITQFVALVTQSAVRMRHIVLRGLPRSTLFFSHYIINGMILENKLQSKKCVF